MARIRTLEEKRDPNVIKTATGKASNAWQIVGSQLAHRGYLAGDTFSLGHIPLGVWARPWLSLPIERSEQKIVNGWYQRLSERPSYRKHVVISVT